MTVNVDGFGDLRAKAKGAVAAVASAVVAKLGAVLNSKVKPPAAAPPLPPCCMLCSSAMRVAARSVGRRRGRRRSKDAAGCCHACPFSVTAMQQQRNNVTTVAAAAATSKPTSFLEQEARVRSAQALPSPKLCCPMCASQFLVHAVLDDPFEPPKKTPEEEESARAQAEEARFEALESSLGNNGGVTAAPPSNPM
jgi:hypothetical protein